MKRPGSGTRRAVMAVTMVAALLAMAIAPNGESLLAESYNEAIARVGNDLRSKNPQTRVAAVEALAMTGETAAVTMTLDMMSREEDPYAARDMGRAVRFFHGKSLEAAEKRILKFTSQAQAFHAFWSILGLAEAKSEATDAVITKAVKESKEKEFWIRAAALEAIADADRTDLTPLVEWSLKNHSKSLEEEAAIVPITATTTAARIAGSGREKFALVSALADMLETYQNERIKFFAAQACSAITGKKAFYDPYYWRDWVKMEGDMGGGEKEPKPSRTANRKVPKFFDAEAVGTRAIFVIDVSGSMAGPVTIKPAPKAPPKEEKKEEGPITGKDRKKEGEKEEKKDPPPPDYSKVKTKLDLAKVELIYTLEQLDETYDFTIVTYHTTHDYLIPSRKGFVKATEGNKKQFIDKVKALTPKGATNIHGALMRGFRTAPNGAIKGDPATDSSVMLNGVDTIFFLTDGHPNVCDEMISEMQKGTGMAGQPHRFSTGDGILGDVRRVNTFRKVVIHTVGIGPHAGELLRAISESSGGTYRDMTGVGG